MSGKSSGKKDAGWLKKTTIDVAEDPTAVGTSEKHKDGSYTNTTVVGDYKVSTTVRYPVYYMVRHKLEQDAEPVAMVCVKTKEEDVGYPVSVAVFLRKNFKITKIPREEAETYDAIGVAPLYSPVEFAKWISEINEDLGKTFTEVGIVGGDGKVKKGKHTYDLDGNIHHKDF